MVAIAGLDLLYGDHPMRGREELFAAIAVAIIALFFIEPLIEYVRTLGHSGHVLPTPDFNNPPVFNWPSKIALGLLILILLMSPEAIRPYVDWGRINRSSTLKATDIELLSAAVIVFFTTYAWVWGARFRLATFFGFIMSVFLVVTIVIGSTLYWPRVAEALKGIPNLFFARVMTPSVMNKETTKAPSDADEIIPPSAKPATAINKADQVPSASTLDANTNKTDEHADAPGAGRTFSYMSVLSFFVCSLGCWPLVALLGGLMIDYQRTRRPSNILIIILAVGTAIWGAVVEIIVHREIVWPEFLVWTALGLGWALGVLITATSLEAICGRCEKDVPALARRYISERWQKRSQQKG